MKKGLVAKFMMLGVVGGMMFSSGCNLTRNIWRGFGESLGGIPANIVVSLVDNLVDIPGVND